MAIVSTDAGQFRQITAIHDKLVLGPDNYMQIRSNGFEGDPMLMVYDTATGTWHVWSPPTDDDWPSGPPVAIPSLGEVWIIGHLLDGGVLSELEDWNTSNNIHQRTVDAGRRIVRFKIE